MALRVAGSNESVMLFQENSAKRYGGYGFPGGFASASEELVLSNSNSWRVDGVGRGLPESGSLLKQAPHPAFTGTHARTLTPDSTSPTQASIPPV